jgi:hypothetical protein
MTDIIKNLEMVSSKYVLIYLKSNPKIITENIEVFKKELKVIGSNKPLILAFGSDAYKILYENLDMSLYSHLIKITHYSHRISKEEYKEEVHSQIKNVLNSPYLSHYIIEHLEKSILKLKIQEEMKQLFLYQKG